MHLYEYQNFLTIYILANTCIIHRKKNVKAVLFAVHTHKMWVGYAEFQVIYGVPLKYEILQINLSLFNCTVCLVVPFEFPSLVIFLITIINYKQSITIFLRMIGLENKSTFEIHVSQKSSTCIYLRYLKNTLRIHLTVSDVLVVWWTQLIWSKHFLKK